MRKRKNSDEEGSEMEVDEEKIDHDIDGDSDGDEDEDEDDDDDDDDEMQLDGADDDEEGSGDGPASITARPVVDNPFMDSFYGLSAADNNERSKAAQVMLQHCLLGPSANSQDAAYAFRRLLNGLCSGRAAARQGNASALASFLKIAFHMEKMEGIRNVASGSNISEENGDISLLAYVRQRLLDATVPNPTTGRKRGSEERDYQFGRLFGIMAIVRSKILLPGIDGMGDSGCTEAQKVSVAMISDLAELFWLRRWMREPAAHGIATMLQLFFESDDASRKIANHLIETVIVPRILIISPDQKEQELGRKALLQTYSAEQIGIAVYIQSRESAEDQNFPLDKPIVCKETIPWIGNALSETSSVVQPRTHFVWDALWCYLTEIDAESYKTKGDSGTVSQRRVRESIPFGDDAAIDVIDSIRRIVLEEKLLRIEKEASTAKTTHERRSLALCIVKNLSGVPFVSSISGPTQILLDADALENVLLTPDITRTLFLNVICAGNLKQKASHLLKPLALEVLGSITKAIAQTDNRRRLSCVRCMLNSDVRFDSRTKTSTVADLLGFSSESDTTEEHFEMWNAFLDHAESSLLHLCTNMKDSDSSADANGYVELLYGSAKYIMRSENQGGTGLKEKLADYKVKVVRRVLGFFMASAFFDLSGLIKMDRKKKKGKKSPKGAPLSSPALDSAAKVKNSVMEGKEIPYPVRSVIAMRFFSLASDYAVVTPHEGKNEEKPKTEKDSTTLGILTYLCDEWKQLVTSGAKLLATEDKDDDGEGMSTFSITEALKNRAIELGKQAEKDPENALIQAKKRCGTGIAVLAMSLNLHRLSCGTNNSMDENPDFDVEEDEEEIASAMEGLMAVSSDFLEGSDDESNPLLGLAEICRNVLASPLGSGDVGRGSSPKLLREAVKYAWLGGLRLASLMATEEKTLLDSSVIEVLLEAVGTGDGTKMDQEEADTEGSDGEGDDDAEEESEEAKDDEDSEDGRIFSKVSKYVDDPEDFHVDEENIPSDPEDDSDVEIDPSKLQTMLEEDTDDIDEDVLEHHEGADGALARLIKMKQDARKSGRQAREKIEVSNQLRCTYLLELLLGRPDGWNRLFRSDATLAMVLPLLTRRAKVAKLVQNSVDSGSKTGTGEKKALLDRLTSLIKHKLCKLRLSSMPLSSSVDMDLSASLVKNIMKEAKHAKDKESGSCCSSCALFVLRTMPSSEQTVEIALLSYGEVVKEWSTKRTSGAFLFDDLITHMPVLAQAALVRALIQATQDARSTFLKVEAYRLLSQLFASKPVSASTEFEKLAETKIHEAQDDMLVSAKKSLEDEEMSKPKRARIVMKTLEKMLPFLSGPLSAKASQCLNDIKIQAQRISLEGGDGGMKSAVDKLVGLIEHRAVELISLPIGEKEEKDDVVQSENKKSKKKKKKKR